jgi:hypothetical protein
MLVRVGLAVCWMAAAAAGLLWLMGYDNSPGVAAHAPASWPAESVIARDPERRTLVMLAHPRCDCTKASLGELAELMARAQDRPQAFVVFIKPRPVGATWNDTALARAAREISGVTVLNDEEGREAARFGAATSGQILLYEASRAGGQLLFSGGTTGARGKSGDNAGRASILALLNGTGSVNPTAPVFGCSLFGPGDAPAEDGHDHES